MYNSTQAQPQVPPVSSPWSKVKKKPRPNGDSNMDEEAGFSPTESSDGPDLYLDDPGVNLSPAVIQHHQIHQHLHQHQPITTTPLRRDRSLSPGATTNPPVSSVLSNVSRSEQMPRSAPASPQKMRPNNPCSSAVTYQTHYGNGYGHHPSHPQIRRFVCLMSSQYLTHFFNPFFPCLFL
jgi:hypothetical protein